jgi:hypothetical protein
VREHRRSPLQSGNVRARFFCTRLISQICNRASLLEKVVALKGHGFTACEKVCLERARLRSLRKSRRFERARLHRLRKNSVFCAVLKGHDFSRAAKRLKINVGFSP